VLGTGPEDSLGRPCIKGELGPDTEVHTERQRQNAGGSCHGAPRERGHRAAGLLPIAWSRRGLTRFIVEEKMKKSQESRPPGDRKMYPKHALKSS
jgi:hypothetical protein